MRIPREIRPFDSAFGESYLSPADFQFPLSDDEDSDADIARGAIRPVSQTSE